MCTIAPTSDSGARIAAGPQQDLCAGPHVAQGQVVALAGDGVEGLGGIAQPHGALADGVGPVTQQQGVAGPRPDPGETQAGSEVGLQAGQVGLVVEGHQGVGFGRIGSVHDGAVVSAGQYGQGALGGEALPGAVAMAFCRSHNGDDGVLAIVPLHQAAVVGALDAALGAGRQAG